MKRTYQAPMASVETFGATDSYCATCYTLACNVDAANQYEKDNKNYDSVHLFHSASACGLSVSQVINDATGKVYEVSTDQGILNCTMASGSSFSEGAYVTWTTSSSDGRTWHHQGTVGLVNKAHPNRS